MEWLEEKNGFLIIHIHLQPRASKNEIVGVRGDALKIKITSPPVEGAANSLLIEFMAKKLGLAKSRIVIASGEKSRHKRLTVEGLSKIQAMEILDATVAV